MSITIITGDHPRHRYLADRLAEAGILTGWIIEQRKPFVPEVPAGLPDDLGRLFALHFRRREEAEERFFGQPSLPDGLRMHYVTPDSLNEQASVDFLKTCAPRIVLSYGCHKIADAVMAALPGTTFWNTHGGLSPQYRGVTTHFWPSYMLEPQMTGMTLHETTSAIDGGAIIHQTVAPLDRNDGLHDIAGRTVKAYADELPPLLRTVLERDLPSGKVQKTSGKIWTSADWRPDHLRLIYEVYNDRIAAAAVDGLIQGRTPICMSVLA
ncbi:formyl transferase [Paracoccus denitrificans]|jgi:folate-dependent phosphoribosylglycinamide formyltransferase PurN|uniref:Formyl transferase N-terminal domain-containing protein n=1 Tax=Paracoccus denitrificans (strain Pd 1222) TaxID=318586 RepID=A1AY63_PARDP|nr:formyl transferase [Paracoccus denitrificans]ABL68207.1 hypothetical protein Pden_0090 [Paracoccus denitrificans PD1222]MBB4630358.1 folate-dependent phosphoribosylglycinamide formyltransferase PurN [Paracoccus denitrificans]MCU7431686.1 formyl transferase [Paracoccus denitrificans]QAR26315.1 methionyl-tRNA formyltransferase [Paracoccus denitrificans]UPV95235.1 formyl transferase [Paracoccus denitrificans]